MAVLIGQNIGKYRVLDRIGKGGMGTVYRAMDEMLHRDVAIKVLNAELNDPEVAKRFRAEAITVARLSHPGIATIYELFEHEGQWLMVMEFVRGETLENMIVRMGPLSAQRSAELAMQALAALAHAHSMGVVHRDLKPANLMITENGAVKVMDFGIARVSGSEHLTNAGFMMGTPAYMAPEQVRGGEVDARADLYAMGVVFYRLTSGKLPFKGDTAFAMVQSQVNEPPTPIGMFRADLPPWVDEIVTRALAKSPDERFQSAVEFHEALARSLAGLSIATMYTSSSETVMTPSRMMSGAFPNRAMPTPSASFPRPGTNSPAHPQAVMTPAAAQAPLSGDTDVTAMAPSGATQRPEAAAMAAAPQAPAKAPAPRTPAKKPIPMAWLGMAGAVVAAAVLIAVFASRRDGAPDPATSEETLTPTPATTPGSDALDPGAPTPTATPTASNSPTPAPAGVTPIPAPAGADPAPTNTPPGRAATSPTPGRAGAPAPTTTPSPVAGADSPEAFGDAKFYSTIGKREVRDAVLHFGNGQFIITIKGNNVQLANLTYKRITKATYVRSRDPIWDPNLASPPKDFDASTGVASLLSRSAKHWLVLQGVDHIEVLRLDDSNAKAIMEMLEARVGIKIDRK
ncbi:MAG TPA: protein kinase [Vicinamibacterales bacterium]|nr:protein kinase [Vicinamibacterales bacterium]